MINYLGTNPYWVGRSASELAGELSLDPTRVRSVFEAFPAIFRKSKQTSEETSEHYYSLQARYALRADKAGQDMKVPDIDPLDSAQVKGLIDQVLESAREESASVRHWVTSGISVMAAVVAAIAAIAAANAGAPSSKIPNPAAESAPVGK